MALGVSLMLSGCASTATPALAYRPAAAPPSLVTNQPHAPLMEAVTRASLISQRSRQQIQIWFDDAEGIAASCGLCTDGPRIFIQTAFLNKFPRDYQVAVIAHEFAHGDLGHVTMKQAMVGGLDAVATSVRPAEEWSDGAALAYGIGKGLAVNAVGRQAEHQADLYAAARLRFAGLSRGTMVGALEHAQKVLGNSGGGWFSTHPLTSERINAVRTTE